MRDGPAIRWCNSIDLAEIAEINQLQYVVPWSVNMFESIFRYHDRMNIVVVEDYSSVVSYAVYEFCKNGITIYHLATHPSCLRHGYGSILIDYFKSFLNKKRTKLTINLSEYNLSGQLFLQYHDFYAIDILNRFFDDKVDAYRFRYSSNIKSIIGKRK